MNEPTVFGSSKTTLCPAPTILLTAPSALETPATWNVIVYGPPLDLSISDIDKYSLFYDAFRDIGRVCFNEYAGDNWAKDLEFYEEQRGHV